jgi:hypothetical protein
VRNLSSYWAGYVENTEGGQGPEKTSARRLEVLVGVFGSLFIWVECVEEGT